jgi:hypothetical protein
VYNRCSDGGSVLKSGDFAVLSGLAQWVASPFASVAQIEGIAVVNTQALVRAVERRERRETTLGLRATSRR